MLEAVCKQFPGTEDCTPEADHTGGSQALSFPQANRVPQKRPASIGFASGQTLHVACQLKTFFRPGRKTSLTASPFLQLRMGQPSLQNGLS